MPGNGLAGSEQVARFGIELKGFLNVLPSTHRWQFCFSELESPKVRKSLNVSREHTPESMIVGSWPLLVI
jgi:hypothetical protein